MKDINLLPDDIRNQQEPIKVEKSAVSKVKVITLIIAILALVGVSLVLPKVYIIMQTTRLNLINEDIESERFNEVKLVNTNIVKIRDEVNRKNGIVLDIDNKSVLIGQILNLINNSIPKGCSLSKIDLSDGKLSIEGNTLDPMQSTEFLSYISRIDSLKAEDSSVEFKDGKYNFKYAFTIIGKGGK